MLEDIYASYCYAAKFPVINISSSDRKKKYFLILYHVYRNMKYSLNDTGEAQANLDQQMLIPESQCYKIISTL